MKKLPKEFNPVVIFRSRILDESINSIFTVDMLFNDDYLVYSRYIKTDSGRDTDYGWKQEFVSWDKIGILGLYDLAKKCLNKGYEILWRKDILDVMEDNN